jgi:hypothetical protein
MSDSSIFNRKQFTSNHREAFDMLKSLSSISIDKAHVMIQINTKHENVDPDSPLYVNPDDLDTFVIATSADPENTISFESVKNVVNLNVRDAGYF